MDKLVEIKEALKSCVWEDGICGNQAWFDTDKVESALILLTEIQNEQAVDVEALKMEVVLNFAGIMDNRSGHLIERIIDYLATRALLRTNEIEPEGRG